MRNYKSCRESCVKHYLVANEQFHHQSDHEGNQPDKTCLLWKRIISTPHGCNFQKPQVFLLTFCSCSMCQNFMDRLHFLVCLLSITLITILSRLKIYTQRQRFLPDTLIYIMWELVQTTNLVHTVHLFSLNISRFIDLHLALVSCALLLAFPAVRSHAVSCSFFRPRCWIEHYLLVIYGSLWPPAYHFVKLIHRSVTCMSLAYRTGCHSPMRPNKANFHPSFRCGAKI